MVVGVQFPCAPTDVVPAWPLNDEGPGSPARPFPCEVRGA